MSKERPILMNGAMVRATLAGAKTQTRRIIKPQPKMVNDKRIEPWQGDPAALLALLAESGRKCQYGRAGDRIWVRETFGYVSPDEHQRPLSECSIEYRADLAAGSNDRPGGWPASECVGDPARPRWRPSIHMPRAASRILLEIVSVRVESLHDISEADSLAEGVRLDKAGGFFIDGADGRHASPVDSSAIEAFKSLWESTGGNWAANPWLWVIEFKRVLP